MPPQLKTLMPAFAFFIIIFLIIRYFLTPVSFGEQGHYRFNSVEENKKKPMHYAGNSACGDCHDDKVEEIKSDMHAMLSCESCHGPGSIHMEDIDAVEMEMPRDRKFCGLCHQMNATRIDKLSMVDLREHNPDKSCIDCHNPHMPWELKEENIQDEDF